MTEFNDNWTTSPIRPILVQVHTWNTAYDSMWNDSIDLATKFDLSDFMNYEGGALRRLEVTMSWSLRWSLIEEISEVK